jgi:hypothetical protein
VIKIIFFFGGGVYSINISLKRPVSQDFRPLAFYLTTPPGQWVLGFRNMDSNLQDIRRDSLVSGVNDTADHW